MNLLSLLIPVILAQGTCYSPSDCAAPLICSSLIDNVFPGTCIESVEDPQYRFQDASSSASSTSSSSSATSSSAASISSANLPPSTVSSSSSPTIAAVEIVETSSSESSEIEGEDEEGDGNILTKAWSGVVSGVKKVWCLFFCE